MRTVNEYRIVDQIPGHQTVPIPANATFVGVVPDESGGIVVCFDVDTAKASVTRKFAVTRTGEEVAPNAIHLATTRAYVDNISYVCHVWLIP